MKGVTIYDIAKHCGVSPATVSRVLSKSDYHVAEPLRKKVLQAAEDLNYIPNLFGKSLKTDCSMEIGVILPNMSNAYYDMLLQGIMDEVSANNYQIILCNSCRDVLTEAKHVETLLQKQVKGILIASIDESDSTINRILASDVPVVAMEQDVSANCLRTGFNFYEGARLAVQHLVTLGHKKIGFATSPLVRASRKRLMNGFRIALIENDLTPEKNHFYISSEENDQDAFYEFNLGSQAAEYFMSLSDRPTAIFCVNDMVAIGVASKLNTLGVKIPEEMAVVGFDNIPFTAMFNPQITSIDQSAYKLGNYSAQSLFDAINNPDKQKRKISILLEPKLVERESTIGRK